MGRTIFVCHSNTDRDLANQVCRDLEAGGLICWIAPRDVAPGAQWAAELAGAIDDCGVFLLIFTTNSNASSQVVREVERAVRRDKVIVNYRSDNIPCSRALDYYLAVHQWFDPTGSVDDDMRRLAVHLRRVCAAAGQGASAAAAGAPRSAPPPRSSGPPPPRSSAEIARVKFNLPAPGFATLPGLGSLYKSVSSLPYLNSVATLSIDGAVAQRMPSVVPATIERPLGLGDHNVELRLRMQTPRQYRLRFAEPGNYEVKIGRTAFTGNYEKRCEISRNGAPPVAVRGTSRFSVWRLLLLCVVALWCLGAILAMLRVT